MKKITLLLLTFFMSFVTYGQGLTENFEGGLPADWVQFNNGLGSPPRLWALNTNPTFSVSVPNSAFSERYQIGQGNTSEDWFVTKAITVPANAQLQFMTRQFLNDDQGTRYSIRVSRTSQTAPASFTQAAIYTEPELNPTGIYEADGTTPHWDEKTINLNALGYAAGQTIYVAFVRVFNQTTLSNNADTRWYIDDVRVSAKCETPTNLQSPTINMTNALLTWVTPAGGATIWEIVVVPEGMTLEQGIAGGFLHTYSGPMPSYNTSPDYTLNPDTNYKYYVRAVCSTTNKSDWTLPYFFTTASLGETCADPIVITDIGYSTTNHTNNSNDRTDVSQGTGCGATPAGTNFMAGNEVFYSFVAPTTGDIRIEMAPTGPNSGIFVYNSCANVGVSCIAGVANTGSGVRVIPVLNVTAGQTYIIVISSAVATQTVGYYLEIQYVTCAEPTNLAVNSVSQTDVTLSWGNTPGYSSWQVAIQPAGALIPGSAVNGEVRTSNTNQVFTTDLAGNPIVASTAYQYWVRALCVVGGTTYSPWAGPFEFFTPICNPATQCNHNFRLTGTGGWQGAIMHVRQNGITVMVLGPQFTTGNNLTVAVPLCNGIPFELVWVNGGTAPATVGVIVQNFFGQLLYQKTAGTGAPGTTPLHTEMVDCLTPKCLPPIGLGANAITANSASLTWTPSGTTTQWEIYISPAETAVAPAFTDPIIPARTTTTRPFPATGLISDTPYVYYIRTICDGTRGSTWVGPFAFRTAVSCGIPTNLAASGQTTTTANLSWTQPASPGGAGTASQWQVVVQGPGLGAPTMNDTRAVALGNGGTYGAAGNGAPLTAATQYEFYVRAVCSPTDVSRWVGPFLFSTACNPIPVPYTEGFNSTSARQLCWSVLSLGGANTWNMDYTLTPFEGDEAASILPNNGTTNDDWLISPILDLRQNYRMRFKYKVASATAANQIEIRISNSGVSPTDFVTQPLWSGSFTNTEYRERVINLNEYGLGAGELVNIAFHLPSGVNNSNRIFIDEVIFEPIPPCPDPMDLGIVPNSITSTSAQLFWTPGFEETQWQVAVQPLGGGVPAATFAGEVTTNNINFLADNITATGAVLQPGNQYEYYVRAICADPNVSQWVGPIVFRTLLCEVADLCPLTFTMTDTASNGWGSTMSVLQNGLVVATLSGPAAGQPSANQVVLLCPGVQYELFWNSGGAGDINQIGVSVTNFYGDVVYTKAPGVGVRNSTLYRGMPFCSDITCPYPTDLTVAQTSGSSVNLTWTPGGTETIWEYIIQPAGGNYPGTNNGTRVTPNPSVVVGNLTPAVRYEYYVRAVCSSANGEYSFWSGPIPFTIYNSPGCIGVEIEDIDVAVNPELFVCPSDPCIDLSATFFQTQASTTYTVERIDYLPPYPFVGGTTIPVTADDDWSPLINLDFNFCFFGNTYNKLLITDNGAITFSIAGPAGNGGLYTPGDVTAGYVLNQPIPFNPGTNDGLLPYVNAIFGVLQDLDPGNSPEDASINYQVLGTAPCRAFVMNIYKLAHFSCNADLETSQMVLYEGSNIIDIYIAERSVCAWNGGNALVGIQNANGTVAFTPPGRNTGQWTAQNEAWRFTPAGNLSNVVFQWLKDDAPYSSNQNINVCVTQRTKMTAEALYDNCDGTVTRRFKDIYIDIEEFPIEDPIDLRACAGTATTFNLLQNDSVILDGIAPEDYEITYYLTLPEAEDGTTGAITTHTTNVDTIIYVRIENPITGCFVTRQFNLLPNNALPAFTVTGDLIICEGDSTDVTVVPTNFALADATFVWTLPDGTVSDQTGSTFNITPANTQAGTYSVKVNNGCETTVEFVLDVNTIVTDFTYPTPICPIGVINPTLAADFTAGGTYGISPALPIDVNTGAVTVTGAAAGDYTVTYTVTPAVTDCTDDKTGQFTFTIMSGITPVTTFTYPQDEYCITDPSPIFPVPGVGFTTGGTYTADPTTGLGLDATTGAIDFTTTTPGLYRVFYTITEDQTSCRAYSQSFFDIRINAAGTATTGFTYTTPVCITSTPNPRPIPVTGFVTGGVYSLVTGSGLVFNTATGEIDLSLSPAGTYTLEYRVLASGCGLGGSSQATIVINPLTVPVVTFSYTTPACENAINNPLPIPAANFVSGGTYSTTDGGVNVDPQTGEIDLANSQPGTYSIKYELPQNNALCRASGDFTAQITISTGIDPVTTFGYSDDSFCSGGTQQGILPTGAFTAGGQFTASPSTGLSLNPTTGEIIVGTSTPGTYVITYLITADAATCRNRSETPFTLTVENNLDVTITDECQDNDYVLIAAPSDPTYTYVWKNAQGAQVGTNSTTFNVSEYVETLTGEVQYPLDFTVTIVTATGCQSIEPAIVTSTFCDIQKGISPNGDGDNETFDLTGFNVKKLTIFNRYGTEVYNFTNYTNQWRGQSNNGNELPDGTYYYVIERSGVPSKTGWIQINRQRN